MGEIDSGFREFFLWVGLILLVLVKAVSSGEDIVDSSPDTAKNVVGVCRWSYGCNCGQMISVFHNC